MQAAFARIIGTARQNHGVVGIHAISDGRFLAVEFTAPERGADVFRQNCARAFGAGERADDFAGRNFGQEALFLFLAARRQDGLAELADGGGKGDGCKRAAKLFHDYAQFEISKAKPAILFGNCRSGPAEIGNLFPQSGVECLAAFVDGADRLGGTFFAQEFVRLILEHLLVVGKIEIHFGSLSCLIICHPHDSAPSRPCNAGGPLGLV